MKYCYDETFIKKHYIMIFCLFAFACHGWIMFNHYPSYSGIALFINNVNVQIREGRWLSAFVKTVFNGGHTLPWVIGLQSIVFISIAAYLVIEIFQIKNVILAVLTGVILISSPTVSCTYVFMHDANSYTLALLLATIGVWCLYRNSKFNGLCYAVLIALSLSLYQTYIAYAIMLIIIYEINALLKGANIVSCLKKWIEYVLWTGVSMVLYVVLNRIVQWMFHIPATNTMDFAHNLHELMERITQCYRSFLFYWWGESFFESIRWILVVEIVIVAVIIIIILFKNNKKTTAIINGCVIICICILFPVITFFIHLISSERDYVSCIRMCGGSIPFLFVICLLQDEIQKIELGEIKVIKISGAGIKKVGMYVTVFLSLIVILFQFTLANTIYMNMHLKYEKDYSVALRIVERVEEHPAYKDGVVLYIIMRDPDTVFSSNESVLNDYLKNTDGEGGRIIATPEGLQVFLEQFIKAKIEIGPGKGKISDEEIESMPNFPKEGSIKCIDEDMYIKL